MVDLTPFVILLILTIITAVYVYLKSDAEGSRPRKFPLFGDLHYSPDKPLINWDAWAKQNGPIVTAKLFGIVPIIILNTSEVATELFSKRSQWYSNRPRSVTMEMITGAGPGKSKFTLLHDYDADLQLYHRILSPTIGAPSTPRYQPLMELESMQLLVDLVALAERSEDHITSTRAVYSLFERTQGSIIMSLHYGMHIPTCEDPILHQVVNMQAKLSHLVAHPGLPDSLPALRHLPALVSPWKRHANKIYDEQTKLYMKLMNHGRSCEGPQVPDLDLAFMLATSIQGGMETSPRQILWLFLGLIQNPAFLKKAHTVLDEVVGHDRLPSFQDRPRLPLIDAAVHELLRWRPVAPGSVPRRAERDDEYKGIKIRKETMIMANAWGIGRDEAVFYPSLGDLDDYVPERWLIHDENNGQPKLRSSLPLAAFGQGRRSCLGKKVAIDGMFIQVARLLWAFDIEPVEEVDPWKMDVVGLMIMPNGFRFKLKP
ncbi:hypothetical protein MRS44_011373 [Fusarium solani]|uniref:Cytochrome P450 n=1 Tax=Fusarium solani TaxID=169388 RepID=A0A9P9KTT6_FUSSL|nr:cytochrome P450 [Fusarium solani]KAH7268354.1 cytochrome P450 [Fusarium solani]KAJ3460506.1 hypothetical protein MRS44_011373 [Fusarium solani]